MGTVETDKRGAELQGAAHKLLALDYFAVLGVSRGAGTDDVKKAFVEAAKAWHPDRVPKGLEHVAPLFAKVFARLEAARATLTDPARRLKYAEGLAKPQAAATAGDVAASEAALEYRKAEVMLKKHDAPQAERHLRRAVHLAPDNAEYRAALVSIEAVPEAPPERLRELAADLDRLIGRECQSARAYYCRGQLRNRLGMAEQAHADFTRAAALDPHHVDAAREVRLYNMRHPRAAPGGAGPKAGSDGDGGIGGLFRRLFKS